MTYQYHDGGRAAAGFTGKARDCVARAISIATGTPYKVIYARLAAANKAAGGLKSAREGLRPQVYEPILAELGFKRCAAPTFAGRKARTSDMPPGIVIARQAHHLVAVIDGVAYDTHDPTEKMVYRYWLLNK